MSKFRKILITTFIVLSSLSVFFGFSACDTKQNDEDPNGGGSNLNYAEFTVHYDYGQHAAGKLTTLLDGSTLFFDPAEYSMDFYAGDIVRVGYTGEMYIQETYPSTVVIRDGEIKTVGKISAQVVELEYTENGLEAKSGIPLAEEQPQYVVDKNKKFYPLSEIEIGKILYGTYPTFSCEEGVDVNISAEIRLSAIYDYDPNFPIASTDVFSWIGELEKSEIVAVETEEGFDGEVWDIAEGEFLTVKKSNDRADIERVYDYLKTVGFRKRNDQAPNVEGYKIMLTIRTTSGEYKLVRKSGYLVENGVAYGANQEIPDFINGETCYKFLTNATKNTLKVYGQEKEVATYDDIDDSIGKLVFKETELLTDMNKRYVLYSDFYWLYIFDETHFWLEEGTNAGKLYEIVGETDFSWIFEQFPR